jgi:hypothetical protein
VLVHATRFCTSAICRLLCPRHPPVSLILKMNIPSIKIHLPRWYCVGLLILLTPCLQVRTTPAPKITREVREPPRHQVLLCCSAKISRISFGVAAGTKRPYRTIQVRRGATSPTRSKCCGRSKGCGRTLRTAASMRASSRRPQVPVTHPSLEKLLWGKPKATEKEKRERELIVTLDLRLANNGAFCTGSWLVRRFAC